MASTDALPVPQKNVAYRLTFPIFKNDGTLITSAAGLDSEVSKDAGTFADCSNEAIEIATSSGVYYLDLSSTEMNADTVAVLVKSSSTGAVPVVITLYPQEADDIRVNVTYLNSLSAGVAALQKNAAQMTEFTVDNTGFTATSTIFETSSITEATANHYVDRLVLWCTGILAGKVMRVTAYSLSSGRGRFTMTDK